MKISQQYMIYSKTQVFILWYIRKDYIQLEWKMFCMIYQKKELKIEIF